jgi:phosphopentomutase
MLYGHRNDPAGFAKCLEEFDRNLGEFLPHLTSDDLLILTADHGNDPTDASTDHTREYAPIAIINPQFTDWIGDQEGYDFVGKLVNSWLQIETQD